MLTVEQAHRWAVYVQGLTGVVRKGEWLIKNPLLVYAGQELWLKPEQQDKVKAAMLDALEKIETFSDKAIALGGTPGKELHQQIDNPQAALSFLGEKERELRQPVGVVEVLDDDELSAVMDSETVQGIKNVLATAGAMLRMWLAWARPQVEAL